MKGVAAGSLIFKTLNDNIINDTQMLKYILIIILLLYTVGIMVFHKSLSNERKFIISAFNLFWTLALVLSLFSFTGRYSISTEAYLLVVMGVFSFNAGFRYKTNYFQTDTLSLSANNLIINKKFNLIILILAAYLLSLFLTYIDALALASVADLRTDFFDEDSNLYGPLFLMLNVWLLKPIIVILMTLFPIALIQKKFAQAFMYIACLLVYNSLGGGRFGYAQIVWSIYLVIICVYQLVKVRLSFRNIFILFVVSIGFYGLIAFTTASRMANFDMKNINYNEIIDETNSQLSAYASGPIAAFSYAIDNNYLENMGGYQYGKLTLGAFDQVLDIFFRKIGIKYERSIPKLATIKQDSKIVINEEFTMWNALYTSNLFYYLDFGVVGVIFFPFLFAVLFSKSLILMHRKQNIMSLVLVNYIFINCMHSVFDFRLYNFSDLVTIVVLLLFSTNSLRIIK